MGVNMTTNEILNCDDLMREIESLKSDKKRILNCLIKHYNAGNRYVETSEILTAYGVVFNQVNGEYIKLK